MALTIISLPSAFSFTSVKRFALQRAGNTVRSKYTGVRQTVVYPYAIWVLEATLVEYDEPQAGLIRSFLVQLEGQKNGFRLPVPGYKKPTTGYTGNALVNNGAGISARATSMAVDGLTPSVPVLNEGDYFTVGDELKVCTVAIASNGSGQATISFMPPLRKPLANNALVTLQNPTILMHMAEDDAADWGISAPNRHKVNFDAIEVIEA
jgi:hypothetical protein